MTTPRLPPLAQVASAIVILAGALNAATYPHEPQTVSLPAGFSFVGCTVGCTAETVFDYSILQSWQHLINDWGQVAGTLSTGDGSSHASIWLVNGGPPIDLGTLPAPYNRGSRATAISDLGQVVGNIFSTSPSLPVVDLYGSPYFSGTHAFIWKDGVMSDLGTLAGQGNYRSLSMAFAINNQGQVAGLATGISTGPIEAVVWQDGTPATLTLGGFSVAWGINDLGQVVGEFSTNHGNGPSLDAFLWQKGSLTDLGLNPVPGTAGFYLVDYFLKSYTSARAINNRGQILGLDILGTGAIGEISSGVVLWSPVP